ncbi:MAG: SpoVA/SpoVAEb family sporulation membrane protein [Erysipelotrichia bacterium]|nr:SpoVA/SpoVAEb family sporulation membrane protein [Erysipelotrichia bacterium]
MERKRIYEQVAQRHSLPSHKLKNAFVAFLVGGGLAVAAQFLFTILHTSLNFSKSNAASLVIIIIIILTAFLTGLGVYDRLAQVCGAGLFIPISGFANALASSALESKSEGLIYGIGSNMFKLAGSVITYGIVSVYILGILRYFLDI